MTRRLTPRRKAAIVIGPIVAAPGIIIQTVRTYPESPTKAMVIAIVGFVLALAASAYVAFNWLPRYSDEDYEPED